jgi:hypothetical protein
MRKKPLLTPSPQIDEPIVSLNQASGEETASEEENIREVVNRPHYNERLEKPANKSSVHRKPMKPEDYSDESLHSDDDDEDDEDEDDEEDDDDREDDEGDDEYGEEDDEPIYLLDDEAEEKSRFKKKKHRDEEDDDNDNSMEDDEEEDDESVLPIGSLPPPPSTPLDKVSRKVAKNFSLALVERAMCMPGWESGEVANIIILVWQELDFNNKKLIEFLSRLTALTPSIISVILDFIDINGLEKIRFTLYLH